MITINQEVILSFFKPRKENAHKGTFGHCLIIAGSSNKMGAALIATKAALRSGSGLVSVCIPKKQRKSVFVFLPEAMVVFRKNKIDFLAFNSIAIGPGLGTKKASEKFLENLLNNYNFPLVLDADALNIIAKSPVLFSKIPLHSILTPHPKEFDRLFGNHKNDLDRKDTAIQKAIELNCIIVLKGHKTFITDGANSYENTTGNAGLAKGGSGDALTGIIAAFLAQNYKPLFAAILGVYLHGLAADITLQTQSKESMLVNDVLENLGLAFKSLEK